MGRRGNISQLDINNISNLIIQWGYSETTSTINTLNLPISFNSNYVPIATTAEDLADGYITSVSTFVYDLSKFQYAVGGWTSARYYNPIYYFCVGT